MVYIKGAILGGCQGMEQSSHYRTPRTDCPKAYELIESVNPEVFPAVRGFDLERSISEVDESVCQGVIPSRKRKTLCNQDREFCRAR